MSVEIKAKSNYAGRIFGRPRDSAQVFNELANLKPHTTLIHIYDGEVLIDFGNVCVIEVDGKRGQPAVDLNFSLNRGKFKFMTGYSVREINNTGDDAQDLQSYWSQNRDSQFSDRMYSADIIKG
jgi:hypothetical protein